MPRLVYEIKKLRADTLTDIRRANRILEEYAAQGYDLTLRQLYYQHVARGLIPNTERSYKRLGSIVNDGRLAGLIDWEHIIDRTRNLAALTHWRDPAHIIGATARSYKVDDHLAVDRIALTMDQIDQYQPPPNPAKISDSRAVDYIANYGDQSWELDALEPSVLSDLIRDGVEALIEPTAWNKALDREREGQQLLRKASDEWETIVDTLNGGRP